MIIEYRTSQTTGRFWILNPIRLVETSIQDHERAVKQEMHLFFGWHHISSRCPLAKKPASPSCVPAELKPATSADGYIVAVHETVKRVGYKVYSQPGRCRGVEIFHRRSACTWDVSTTVEASDTYELPLRVPVGRSIGTV